MAVHVLSTPECCRDCTVPWRELEGELSQKRQPKGLRCFARQASWRASCIRVVRRAPHRCSEVVKFIFCAAVEARVDVLSTPDCCDALQTVEIEWGFCASWKERCPISSMDDTHVVATDIVGNMV